MRDAKFMAKLRRRQERNDRAEADRKLQEERDSDPNCANEHVMAWRLWRDLARREAAKAACFVPKPKPVAVATEDVEMRSSVVIEIRKVPNPMLTEELIEAIDKGESQVPRQIGAAINVSTLLGGFARIKDRTRAQTEAVAQYRQIYDRSLIGGAKAIDYEAVRVDVSIGSASRVLDDGEDARQAYQLAVRKLGTVTSRVLELVVCEGRSVREVADMFGFGGSMAKRVGLRKQLLRAADILVEHFRLDGPKRARLRSEGDRPMGTETNVVIHRKTASTA